MLARRTIILCSSTIVLLLLAMRGTSSNETIESPSPLRVHIYNSTKDAITFEYRENTITRRETLQPSGTRTLNVQALGLFEIKVIDPPAAAKFSRRIAPRRTKALVLDIGARGEFFKCPVRYYQGCDVHKPLPSELAADAKLPGLSALYDVDLAFEGINVPAPQLEVGPLFCGVAMTYILVDAIGLQKRRQGLPVGP